MKYAELFEKYLDEYGINYEKIPNESGISLNVGNVSVELTEEIILAISGLDESFALNMFKDLKTEVENDLKICSYVDWHSEKYHIKEVYLKDHTNMEKLSRYEYNYLDLTA